MPIVLRDKLIELYRPDGTLAGTETVQVPVDTDREATLAEYREACATILGGTTGVQVKAFVRALNKVLRLLDSEVS